MIRLLALPTLPLTPGRRLFLLLGFSMGVAVMIVLLSIGEALLDQAKDEKLVGGGTITVLPEGVDVEVLKTGGAGGLLFSLRDHALIPPPGGRELQGRASADIPSLPVAVGASPQVVAGTWSDDSLDRRWHAPTAAELRHDIDHFHRPPPEAAGDPSWGGWHYFNVISPDRTRWAFVSFIVAGAVGDSSGRWGGQVLVTLHEQGKAQRRFTSTV